MAALAAFPLLKRKQLREQIGIPTLYKLTLAQFLLTRNLNSWNSTVEVYKIYKSNNCEGLLYYFVLHALI